MACYLDSLFLLGQYAFLNLWNGPDSPGSLPTTALIYNANDTTNIFALHMALNLNF